jgi:hypothetical protein
MAHAKTGGMLQSILSQFPVHIHAPAEKGQVVIVHLIQKPQEGGQGLLAKPGLQMPNIMMSTGGSCVLGLSQKRTVGDLPAVER